MNGYHNCSKKYTHQSLLLSLSFVCSKFDDLKNIIYCDIYTYFIFITQFWHIKTSFLRSRNGVNIKIILIF